MDESKLKKAAHYYLSTMIGCRLGSTTNVVVDSRLSRCSNYYSYVLVLTMNFALVGLLAVVFRYHFGYRFGSAFSIISSVPVQYLYLYKVLYSSTRALYVHF
jgi:hypothetical protein